ncbi:uncharacterized protein [Watersipora subatra]|uniref:uncharacterized protein isoform X2 n=1 Tax=Watersipora subatra TaxID=2589382 RepID=UPI00355BAFB1
MSSEGDNLLQSKTKPRGSNVRAFIEMVEKGKKPEPDFFNSKPNLTTKSSTFDGKKTSMLTTKARSFSGEKPPILTAKPSLKQNRHAPALVIISSSCRGARHTPGEKIPQPDEEDTTSVEVRCPSEDSGHSTCDLKYSGSLSSNHSSSQDPNYQVLSELDDTFSERTSSSYGTTGSAATEPPHYSDPSVVETTTDDTAKYLRPARGGGSNKSHISTYKYHVPSKLNGTLPRDRKKAAILGKAVAKGRTTLTKKSTKTGEDKTCGSYTLTESKSETISSKRNAINLADSDSGSDSDFSDSEWETDGEGSDGPCNDNQSGSEAMQNKDRLSTRIDNNNDGNDDSNYDTCIPSETHPESRSKFYYHDNQDSRQLLELMREHSGKKQAGGTKSFRFIKFNSQDFKRKTTVQKLVESSSSTLAAVKTFFAAKRKKAKADGNPQTSKTEIVVQHISIDTKDSVQPNTDLSSMDMHHSDSQSDVNSVSSHNSHGPASDSGRVFIPREKTTLLSSRHRTQSAGSVMFAPPLPPRNTKSMNCDEGMDLGVLPAPPPPPRTTSRAHNTLGQEDTTRESDSSCYEEIEHAMTLLPSPSYTRKFMPAKSPKPLPRSPRLVGKEHKEPTSSPQIYATVVDEDPHIHKAASTPAFPSSHSLSDTTAPIPHIPLRKESSLTLIMPSSDDESVRRRTEILNSARATVQRNNSFKTTPPIEEEEAPGILRCKSPITDSSSPRITESKRVTSQLLVEDETLYQSYHECILSSVKDRSRNKSKIVFSQVVTSEASYLRSIMMLSNVFYHSKQFCNEEILCARDKKDLFSNITAVLDVSTRLFGELEEHWKENVILTDVCELVSKYAHSDFDVYIKYCSNQAFQDKTLKKLSDNARFQEALATLERSKECQGLNMSSFLLLPMQRVVSRCNEGARKMEQTEQIINIENKLLFNKLKKIPLASQSRQLVKQGDLQHMSADGAKSAVHLLNVKPKTLSLFLFNDLLLITKKKGDNFTVIDYASRANISTELWKGDQPSTSRPSPTAQKSQAKAKFMFMLLLLQNHQKKHSEFLFSCQSETERTRWVEAFLPPVTDDTGEKIYESWDCPQVQVTHDYSAQQPDELNLQIGDVVNVLRKTPDGWYEGERVTDGRRGWLPKSYTLELQNEHVRARHLKERNKLLQAAAQLLQ